MSLREHKAAVRRLISSLTLLPESFRTAMIHVDLFYETPCKPSTEKILIPRIIIREFGLKIPSNCSQIPSKMAAVDEKFYACHRKQRGLPNTQISGGDELFVKLARSRGINQWLSLATNEN